MSRSALLSCTLVAAITFAGASLAADEPTLHQIYQAADAGRLIEAQSMMGKVLRDHPSSAKAHFVEAELLVKQGQLANAQIELTKAEILAPGLPFAKAGAVANLKHRITPAPTPAEALQNAQVAQSRTAGEIPWGLLVIGLGLMAAVIFFVRSMSQHNPSLLPAGGGAAYGTGFGAGAPLQPYGSGGVSPAAAPAAGGIGSGILGGLATGAALGAGMVAGQSLMHHLADGNRNPSALSPLPSALESDIAPNEMGGSDFGISDSSSWDDSYSGGSDWND